MQRYLPFIFQFNSILFVECFNDGHCHKADSKHNIHYTFTKHKILFSFNIKYFLFQLITDRELSARLFTAVI